MTVRFVMIGLLLAGCASSGGNTPRERCQAQSYDDPTVKQLQAIAAGSESWAWQFGDKLKIAREQAIARCLQGQAAPGTVRRGGGVEAPR